ncbi:MAG: hypothetical protein IKJ24_07205 [Clostridia bacterium]|nr:hypothetical protein [Clostridia bacterium]
MKKFLCLIMGVLLIMSSVLFVGCDNDNGDTETKQSETAAPTDTETETQASEEIETLENGSIVVEDVAGKSAYQAYLDSSDADLTNYTAKTTTLSVTEYGASKTVSTVNVDLYVDGELIYMVTSSPDTPFMSSEMWYADGYLYVNADDEKYKEEMSYEDFVFMYLSESADDMDFAEEDFAEAIIAKNKDGSYSVIIDLSEILSDIYVEEEDAGTYTITYEMIYDMDGELKCTVVSYEATMEMDGVTVCTSNISSTEISAIGTTKVTLPEDIDSYEEYDWDFDDEEFPDMSDWTDEEIESWYDAFFGEEIEE